MLKEIREYKEAVFNCIKKGFLGLIMKLIIKLTKCMFHMLPVFLTSCFKLHLQKPPQQDYRPLPS